MVELNTQSGFKKNTLKNFKMATALHLEVISSNFNIYVYGVFFVIFHS